MNPHVLLVANLGESCGGGVGVGRAASEDQKVVNAHGENWERAANAGSDVSSPEVL